MSDTLRRIIKLIDRRDVRISDHGYDEMAADDILLRELLAGAAKAELVEDYPTFHKGPAVLVLQSGEDGRPIHALWGIPKDQNSPAVLITAYRPDPDRWHNGYKRRR